MAVLLKKFSRLTFAGSVVVLVLLYVTLKKQDLIDDRQIMEVLHDNHDLLDNIKEEIKRIQMDNKNNDEFHGEISAILGNRADEIGFEDYEGEM